jgi:hypothetical protein
MVTTKSTSSSFAMTGARAIEVKLAHTVDDSDVRHLRWLGEQLGD